MGLYMIWDVGASSDMFFIDCMFIVQIHKKNMFTELKMHTNIKFNHIF